MPEHIRALAVILFLSSIVFAFASRPASDMIPRSDFSRRRNLWLILTITAFLAHNIWVYFLVAGSLLLFTRSREPNPVALFFALLFVIAASGVQIPGVGLINYLFTLSHQRLLALVILLPVFITLMSQKQTLPFGRTVPDKLLAAYIVLVIILYLRETTITDTLRQAFYQFIDIFLPYYVISRSLKSSHSIREALLSFVIAAMLLALIGAFEAVRHWLLYAQLEQLLGIPAKFSNYLERAGALRANASVGTIPLGYLMTIGIGFFLYLQQFIHSRFRRQAGFLLLAIGLVASLSRGPWVGAVFLIAIFILTGRRAFGNMSKFLVAGILALSLISILPGGERLINLLPYLGDTEQGNISYRERLIENSLIVIGRNPWFGSVGYLETPEMEVMRQGQGIIDVVNTYIGITLETGLVGFTFFTGFFLTIWWGIFKAMRRLPNTLGNDYQMGRALLATLAAILLIIFTVSSVSIIPIVYWSVAGLGAAYINMMDRSRREQYKGEHTLT
jgi:O-antigen ligase